MEQREAGYAITRSPSDACHSWELHRLGGRPVLVRMDGKAVPALDSACHWARLCRLRDPDRGQLRNIVYDRRLHRRRRECCRGNQLGRNFPFSLDSALDVENVQVVGFKLGQQRAGVHRIGAELCACRVDGLWTEDKSEK